MEFLTKTSMKAEPQLPENIECKLRVTDIHYLFEIECIELRNIERRYIISMQNENW